MADNVARHNQNAVNLAILLDDPTTGADNGIKAAADGKWLSGARKNYYLHEAYRWVGDELVRRLGIERASGLSTGLIKRQAITFASAGVAVNKDYLYSVRLVKSNMPQFVLGFKADFDLDIDRRIERAYSIEADGSSPQVYSLFAYERSSGTLSLLNSGTGTLYYLKAERIDSNGADVVPNTTPDITIDRRWHDVCVLYAAGRACWDKSIMDNSPEWELKGNKFKAQAMDMLPKGS